MHNAWQTTHHSNANGSLSANPKRCVQGGKSLGVAVFGASGYSGSELLAILNNHAYFTVHFAFSSERSEAQPWRNLAPQLAGTCELMVQPWQEQAFATVVEKCAAVFLALPHEASAVLAAKFHAAGVAVFDLSGAYRFQDAAEFAATYGFEHPHPELLPIAQYMLMEWQTSAAPPQHVENKAPLCAIPGCYPTAASLALKPLTEMQLIAPATTPVITAISGVSGAGRGLNARTAFCEVSVQAYGVGNHRHMPEIKNNLGCPVSFTPQLGNYKRGIVATCIATLADGVTAEQVHAAFQAAYSEQPFVRLVQQPPAVDHVANTPFCDVYVNVNGNQVVVISAIDNLLKGAASQAVHAANSIFGLPEIAGFERFFADKPIKVIKVGGALLQQSAQLDLKKLLAVLAQQQQPYVLVHGGGALVDEMLTQAGMQSEKVGGQRVSAPEQMNVIVGALAGTTNKQLVNAAVQHGIHAVGMSLADGPLWQMQAEPSLGQVGVPTADGFSASGKALLTTLLKHHFTPIVSSIGSNADGELCNVNADYAAAAIAMALNADLLLLSDVPAILNAEGNAIGSISLSEAEQLLQQSFVTGGMLVKLQAAILTSSLSRRTTAIASWADSQAVIAFLTDAPAAHGQCGTSIRP